MPYRPSQEVPLLVGTSARSWAGARYTKHTDGSETETGVVTAYDAPHGFTVTWQIGADWAFHDDLVTTIEVRFTPTDDGRTLVELEHRDLEAYGADAAQM